MLLLFAARKYTQPVFADIGGATDCCTARVLLATPAAGPRCPAQAALTTATCRCRVAPAADKTIFEWQAMTEDEQRARLEQIRLEVAAYGEDEEVI